jgi:hypothetical protein
MKIGLVMIFVAFLSGCSADNSSNTEPDQEPKMFGKNSTQTYVIFSPMKGVLLQDGKPLANAKIIRTLSWNDNDKKLVEEFVTDEQGRFNLTIHEEQLSLSMLSQFVGKADLEFETDAQRDYLWTSSKFYPEIYAETDGEVEDLVCDIAAEEIAVPMGPTSILTKCRWKNMPD